jgi:hypothetical protein
MPAPSASDPSSSGVGNRGIGHHVGSAEDPVGLEEEGWGDREPQGLGGFEIDDQLELRRLLHGQVGGLGAFQGGGRDSGPQLTDVEQRTLGSSCLFLLAGLARTVPSGTPLSLTFLL